MNVRRGRPLEQRVLLLLHEQSEVEQPVGHRVPAVCGDQVFALREAAHGLLGELHHGVLVARGSRLMHLDAVDVELGVVVVRELHVDRASLERLVEREGAAHPDVLVRPVGLCGRFVDLRAEGAAGALPCLVGESRALPSLGGLRRCVASLPGSLLRGRHHGGHLHLFGAHETVGDAVHLEYADQREVLPGPVFHGTVIEVVGHRPCAGVGVDRHERVGRSAECARDCVVLRRLVPAAGREGGCSAERQ